MTVILVIVALQAVMSTIRVQRMVGDIGRNDTELLAAYLARNKKADKATKWLITLTTSRVSSPKTEDVADIHLTKI